MAEASRPPVDHQHHQEITEPNHKKMAEDDNYKHQRERKSGGYRYAPKNRRSAALCGCVVLLLLAGITVLIAWLIYRPQKPQFTVTSAAIYVLKTTTSPAPLISATMQFTILTRNPNHRVSIFYDHLVAFVTYKNQMITPPVVLPPLFHEKHTTVALSPVMGGGGGSVVVSVDVLNGLEMDEGYGVMGLRVVLLGKMRWKAGIIWTGRYGISVKCDVLLGLKNGFLAGQLPLLQYPHCKVS